MSDYSDHAVLNSALTDIETRDAPDREKFVTASRLEINQIMHALTRGATLVTASLGNEEFLTSVVAVNERTNTLMLECGRKATQNERVLRMDKLVCSSYLDRVMIRFECTDIEAATYDGHQTIRTAMPRQLLRLQRREYYRMPTPLHAPLKCSIFAAQDATPGALELNVIDISCGGIGVVTSPKVFMPQLGECYGCTVNLPGTGTVAGQVQVRNAFKVTLPNHTVTARSGFAFMKLPESMLATIQRYNMNLERQSPRFNR